MDNVNTLIAVTGTITGIFYLAMAISVWQGHELPMWFVSFSMAMLGITALMDGVFRWLTLN